jgi:hypothetical protein
MFSEWDAFEQRVAKQDKIWWFYHCPSLGCAFYYNPGKKRYITRPVLSLEVWTPTLERKVPIKLAGQGLKGFQAVKGKTLYPVNLFISPPIIDPKPSNTVTDELYLAWQKLVARELKK